MKWIIFHLTDTHNFFFFGEDRIYFTIKVMNNNVKKKNVG